MSSFSNFSRYRNVGEHANVNNVNSYGLPCYSLFTSTGVLSLHQHTEITDEMENVVYISNSKVLSLHDKTEITDRYSAPVSYIERKVFSLHARHFITMANGIQFELSRELFHLYNDIINIDGLGWQLRGNIWGLNFELWDGCGNLMATISQKMFSIHDKYCIDIYCPDAEPIVVTILITLQHMIRDRSNSGSGSSGSSN